MTLWLLTCTDLGRVRGICYTVCDTVDIYWASHRDTRQICTKLYFTWILASTYSGLTGAWNRRKVAVDAVGAFCRRVRTVRTGWLAPPTTTRTIAKLAKGTPFQTFLRIRTQNISTVTTLEWFSRYSEVTHKVKAKTFPDEDRHHSTHQLDHKVYDIFCVDRKRTWTERYF